MGITIQRSTDDLGVDWADISVLSLKDGDEITLQIANTEATAKTARLYVAGIGNLSPGSVGDRQGAEAAAEGWLEAKLPADGSWVALTFPTAFPTAFADLDSDEGAFPITIAASTETPFMVRYAIPAGATTAGELRLNLALRRRDA